MDCILRHRVARGGRVFEDPCVSRLAPVLLIPALALLVACGQSEEPSTASPADADTRDSPAGSQAVNSEAGAKEVLRAEILQVATEAPKVETMKLRFDSSGALVKQAVYHDDAAAVPEAVRALAEQTYPRAKVTGYETEHYADRGEVFEVELETGENRHCEVAATAEGVLVYTECRVDARELPAPVAERVTALFADGEILEAEHKTLGAEGSEGEEYSVEVKHAGREYYLRIASDGSLLSKHLRVPAVVELPVD